MQYNAAIAAAMKAIDQRQGPVACSQTELTMNVSIARSPLRKVCGATVLLLVALASTAQAAAPDLDRVYAPYQQLLDRHLIERKLPSGGLISAFDYRGALACADLLEKLDAQRERLARFEPDSLDARAPALAFWINAYNYFMLDYLLRNPVDGRPVDSVRDYGSLVNPYAVFKRELFEVGGRNYSLQEIELEVLLGEVFAERGWKDARVHFMVNCASVGCPALRADIYTAGNIEAMLATNTRRALDTPLHLDRAGDRLHVTSLFDWYADDFVEHSGSVRAFIGAYGSDRARRWLQDTEEMEFIDYDWSLNSPENFDAVLRELGVESIR